VATDIHLDLPERFGYIKEEVSDCANFDIPILEEVISCSCGYIVHSFGRCIMSKGELDHPIAFSSRKMSTTEKNYTMT
jgi:hypothetical protein